MKKISPIILLLFVLPLLLTGCGNRNADTQTTDGSTPNTASEQSVSAFPNLTTFQAITMDGGTFTNADLEKYDVTVINIWSTTCPPCIEELPALEAFRKQLPANVNLITYCLDGVDNAKTAEAILAQTGFSGTTILPGGDDLAALTRQVMYTPTTVFVDSSGKMVSKEFIGAAENPGEVYTQSINSALKAMGKDVIQ